jgi:hypothetical protein
MAAEHYRQFVDQLCEHTLISDPAALYHDTHLAVRDVNFSLFYLDDAGPGTVSVLCDFGPLPARRSEEVMKRLLETNFYLFDSPGSPGLSFNEVTQRVVLACRVPLRSVDAPTFLEMLGQFSDMAKGWRVDYFLNDPAKASPTRATAPMNATQRAIQSKAALRSTL